MAKREKKMKKKNEIRHFKIQNKERKGGMRRRKETKYQMTKAIKVKKKKKKETNETVEDEEEEMKAWIIGHRTHYLFPC